MKLIVSTDKKTYEVCESVEHKTLKKRNCFCFPLQAIVLILPGTFTGSKWSSLMVEVTSCILSSALSQCVTKSLSFLIVPPVCWSVQEPCKACLLLTTGVRPSPSLWGAGSSKEAEDTSWHGILPVFCNTWWNPNLLMQGMRQCAL